MTTDAEHVDSAVRARSARPERPLVGSVFGGAFGASAAALAAAAADAHWAFRASPDHRFSRLALLLCDAGVLAPLALAIGILVGSGTLLLDIPRAGALATPLRTADPAARARISARLLTGVFTGFVAVVVDARAAEHWLASAAPALSSGGALTLTSIALGVAVVGLVAWVGRVAEAHPPAWLPTPPRAFLLGAALLATLVALGVFSGDTNGGGGLLGILGVLKREELDLRGVALLSVLALGGSLGPEIARRFRPGARLALVAAPLALTGYAGLHGLAKGGLALALERGAPLGRYSLSVLQRLTDFDHDGASGLFGGGDCNDRDARVSPAASDVPGNGIDEDCSGADETPQPSPRPENVTATGASTASFREAIPKDLSVVLITVDTLRGDLGYAGNPRPVSPHIDELARRSVVFDRAYSLASYTGKSLGPMLIGKYSSETHRPFDHFDRFGTDETFVQERLRRAGIRTLTAQGHWYFTPETGLARGFDAADFSAMPRVPQAEGDRTVNGDKLTDAAIHLLTVPENVARPFYLWVHYVDPHAAYVPHPGFDFGNKSRDLYDGEVAFVDHEIGRLLSFIAASDFSSRTAIVLTSDHGEAFGEHGLVRHGFELWEELVRVPLVVFVPGARPHRVSVPRSAIDLVPTLLDLFGAPAPSGQGSDFVSGRSLLDDVFAPPGAPSENRPVFVDMSEGPHNAERQALVDGSVKLIATNGRPLGLYDLGRDPGETRDLLADGPGRESALAAFRAFRRTLRSIPPRK
jgi:arylsulfatase A-like enzyme